MPPGRKGNGQIAKSMQTAALRTEVVRKFGLGFSFGEIARTTAGVYDASHASKLFDQAIVKVYEPTVREARAKEKLRLESMDEELAKIVAEPPPALTAAGKIVYQPGTETFERDADGNLVLDKYSKPIITGGEPIVDKSVVVRAIAERRKVGESYRKMIGADAETTQNIHIVEQRAESQRALEALRAFILENPEAAVRVAAVMGQPPTIQAVAEHDEGDG